MWIVGVDLYFHLLSVWAMLLEYVCSWKGTIKYLSWYQSWQKPKTSTRNLYIRKGGAVLLAQSKLTYVV